MPVVNWEWPDDAGTSHVHVDSSMMEARFAAREVAFSTKALSFNAAYDSLYDLGRTTQTSGCSGCVGCAASRWATATSALRWPRVKKAALGAQSQRHPKYDLGPVAKDALGKCCFDRMLRREKQLSGEGRLPQLLPRLL
jgi:hypothetical protein